jgi:ketosteroid isomerase-like protein
MPDNLALTQRLLDAWNQGDVTTVLALVTPEVEIETPGGVGRGSEAVRAWVDKQTQPHAVMHIVLDQLLEAGDRVVVFARRQMRWRETDELADETPLAALLTFWA